MFYFYQHYSKFLNKSANEAAAFVSEYPEDFKIEYRKTKKRESNDPVLPKLSKEQIQKNRDFRQLVKFWIPHQLRRNKGITPPTVKRSNLKHQSSKDKSNLSNETIVNLGKYWCCVEREKDVKCLKSFVYAGVSLSNHLLTFHNLPKEKAELVKTHIEMRLNRVFNLFLYK